jgi:hypothetical protein
VYDDRFLESSMHSCFGIFAIFLSSMISVLPHPRKTIFRGSYC